LTIIAVVRSKVLEALVALAQDAVAPMRPMKSERVLRDMAAFHITERAREVRQASRGRSGRRATEQKDAYRQVQVGQPLESFCEPFGHGVAQARSEQALPPDMPLGGLPGAPMSGGLQPPEGLEQSQLHGGQAVLGGQLAQAHAQPPFPPLELRS
jgi:hypothetical protein